MPGASALNSTIVSALRERLAALHRFQYAELLSLPDSSVESVVVLGVEVAFSTLRQLQADGRILVLVRSDRPLFLGLGSQGTTEGFWVDSSGAKREALYEEIAEYFA